MKIHWNPWLVVDKIEENWKDYEGGPLIERIEEGPMGMWTIIVDGKEKLVNYY